jgi:hypothetical protein
MAIVRAIQFICRHVLQYQVLSNHTDGKRLSVAPNTTKTISHNIFNSFICGKLGNNHQYGHHDGHINQHHNRDLTHIQGRKES